MTKRMLPLLFEIEGIRKGANFLYHDEFSLGYDPFVAMWNICESLAFVSFWALVSSWIKLKV